MPHFINSSDESIVAEFSNGTDVRDVLHPEDGKIVHTTTLTRDENISLEDGSSLVNEEPVPATTLSLCDDEILRESKDEAGCSCGAPSYDEDCAQEAVHVPAERAEETLESEIGEATPMQPQAQTSEDTKRD